MEEVLDFYEEQYDPCCPLVCFDEKRHVEMTEHRTKLDYAHQIHWLVDEVYPHAFRIRVVQDNLNTHTAAALYEAFEEASTRSSS